MKYTILIATLFLSIGSFAQPKISFSFDDGSLGDRPGYPLKKWNTMLLTKMDSARVKSIFFVAGRGKTTEKGRYLLKSWNEKGHLIANHTYSHPNYSKPDITFEDFSKEILKNDSIIRNYSNYVKLFRFPYLKEGNTEKKVGAIRKFLKENAYNNGYVTIDASDWYIDSRLLKRLRKNPSADISAYKEYYLNHLWEKAQYYEKLSFAINERHINHTLLLHHNLAAALFIDDLIAMFKAKGWQIVSAKEAYTDPIYMKTPRYAGESLIYALLRDSKKFDHLLRFPPEDSQYEKKKMDLLGL
jgi:peptidoglycan/xylan/chitin deacetylase (PgdA/CDA1 family)